MTIKDLIDAIRVAARLQGLTDDSEVAIVCETKNDDFDATYGGVGVTEDGKAVIYFTKSETI